MRKYRKYWFCIAALSFFPCFIRLKQNNANWLIWLRVGLERPSSHESSSLRNARKKNEPFCITWGKRFGRTEYAEYVRQVVVFEPVSNTGFVNQLRGIVSSLFYAVLTERDFFINWSEHNSKFNLESYLEPSCLDWRLTNSSIFNEGMETDQLDRLTISGSRRGMGHPKVSLLLQTKDMNEVYSRDVVVISSNDLFFDNFFHNKQYCQKIKTNMHFNHPDEVFKVVFNYLFRPSEELQAIVDNTLYKLEPKIGIQMRLGGSINDRNFKDPASKKMAIPNSNRGMFQGCLEHILGIDRYRHRTPSRIFVTSDSSDFRKYFSRTRYKLISIEGPVEHTGTSRVTHKGLLKVFADFIVLSRCEVIVVSPGTFGSGAALAGGSSVFYHVNNSEDATHCTEVVCHQDSRYCAFGWSGMGVVTSKKEFRTHLQSSQIWEPYIAMANSEGKTLGNSKILLKKLDKCE